MIKFILWTIDNLLEIVMHCSKSNVHEILVNSYTKFSSTNNCLKSTLQISFPFCIFPSPKQNTNQDKNKNRYAKFVKRYQIHLKSRFIQHIPNQIKTESRK